MAYAIGDPNHIAVHNNLVTEVQELADNFSVEVTLPDVAGLGDTGHVDDHNLIVAAIQKIADEAQAPSAIASGGTETTYTGDGTNGVSGQAYKVHTFTANGTLTVTSPGVADVLVVASGGGGSGKGDGIGASGGGGGVIYANVNLTVGNHNIVVGAAVGYNGTPFNGNGGNPSQFDGLYAYGGGYGAGEDGAGGFGGSGGGGGGGNNIKPGGVGIVGQGNNGGQSPTLFGSGGGGGAGGPGSGSTPGPGRVLYISGAAVEYGKGGIDGRAGDLPGMGGGSYEGPGTGSAFTSAAGIVIVRYKI